MRNLIVLLLLCIAFSARAQYSETFSVADKGYKLNLIDDLTAVNWSLTPWAQGGGERDASDYFSTTAAGVLECVDLDQEVCWESPLINTTAAATVSVKVDLTWVGFDTDIMANTCATDNIKVMYSVNGGAYTMIPNVVGGSVCATIGYVFENPGTSYNGNFSINHGGIAGGSTLKIRVCVMTNANAEIVTIDNVSVPEAGVTVGCASPVLSTVITQVGCSNPNSGAIDLTVSAGTPGYNYAWSNGPTTQDLTGRPVGTYTVTVTDAASCTASISASITAAPAITRSTTVLDASCQSNLDGEVDLVVSGGVPGYTYDWSNDGPEAPDNDAQDLIGVGTGTYTVTITDASGCSSTISATVNVQPSGAYLEQFNTANKGYLAGFIDDFSAVNWTMTGWSPQPPALFGRDANDSFSTVGGKLVGVDFDQEICWISPLIDLNGGTQFSVDLAWAQFDVQTDEYINVSYSIDGGAFINIPNLVGGGAGTIQYAAGLDQSGSQTVTKTGLAGTTIQIQVCGSFNADAESMTIDNVTIPGSNPYCPAPEPSLTPTNVTCNGAANGSITNTVSNGTPPFTYSWSNMATTQNLSNLGPGTYTVTVTDANMQTGTASAMITEPPVLALSTTQVNLSCNGGSNGSIDLTVTGGTPGYTYLWSNGGTTQDRTGLVLGIYTVTVTDSKSCTKTISATITQPTVIALTETHVNVLCNGSATGSIDLTVSGGTGGYTYNWGSGVTTQDRTGLIAGTYTVTVTDANACTKTLSTTITQPTVIALTETHVNVLCNGSATGSIDLTVSGGTSGYSYAWSSGPTTQDITGLIADTYTVTVTDANSCTKTLSVSITQPTALTLATVPVNILCNGAATGSIDLTPSGGMPGYTYAWTGGATTQDRAGLVAGTYTVTVTDANNCSKTTSVTLTEPAASIVLSSTFVTPSNCAVADGSIDLSVSGGFGAYTYDWSNDGPETPDNDTQDLSGLVEGTYTVTVTDANGCTATHSRVLDYIDVVNPSITCPANVIVNANVACAGTVGSYSAASVGDNCNPNPAVSQSPASGTALSGHNDVETITLTANDGNGNTASCNFTVTLKDVTVPSITCPANTTINANASCGGSLGTYAALSVSDNCTANPSVSQSPASGTALSGHNDVEVVTLTANDGNGNTNICTFTVTLKDLTVPSITCPANTIINANGSCGGSLGTYVALSVSDNCTANPSVSQSPASGTTLSGHNDVKTVTLTANDGNGNTANCTFTVTLKDITVPSITCPANTIINANASCGGSLGTYAALSVSDNCTANPSVNQSPAAGTALSGHNDVKTVTLTANDGNGNTNICTFTVTLKDVTVPSITCPANTTINANASCGGSLGTYAALSVSDNCTANPSVSQSPAAGTALSGHNDVKTVTLTANDGNGNTNICTFTVTLKDVTVPAITCPANTIINANASCGGSLGTYSALSVSDNCTANPSVSQSPAAGTALSGHNDVKTVTLTANDGNGNTNICTFTVTLKDVTVPSISCPANTTINASATCGGTLGSYSALSVSDNCTANPSVSQSPASGTTLSGHNDVKTVTLTANDGNGNSNICTFTVTLKDVTAPSITCPANVTVAANGSCAGTVGTRTAATVSDNCNANPSVTQSPAAATSLNGHNDFELVTLTASDGNGNSSTCTFTVTLKDVTPPNITCPSNITLNANASCQATIGAYLPLTLTDNCSNSSTASQSPAAGSLISGHNTVLTVSLTGSDGNGNTQNCNFTVTLKDITPPVLTCKNFIADLDAVGAVSISPSAVFQSGTDNCGVVIPESVSPSSFQCNNIGPNLVTLTANDGNGNTATCTATVTVRDITPPVAKCKNITSNLNALGTVTVAPASVSNGTADNCSFTLTLTPNTFSCANIGSNQVTLRATDAGGNTSTCSASITVKDVTAPNARCKNPTIFLNEIGQATLSLAQVNNASSDACGISTMSINKTMFNCSEILGINTVRLDLTDVNGNTAYCLSTVTVKDAIAPTAYCENVTVELAANGFAVVYGANLASESTDNCSVYSYMPVAQVYKSANVGNNNLTITVKDYSGNAATCVSVVTVEPHVGLREETPEAAPAPLHVYPNPGETEVFIAFEMPSEQAFQVKMYDMQGRLVLDQSNLAFKGENILPIRLDGFAPGVYLIDFQSADLKTQTRLLVQR